MEGDLTGNGDAGRLADAPRLFIGLASGFFAPG
jgi:hypothetical protein